MPRWAPNCSVLPPSTSFKCHCLLLVHSVPSAFTSVSDGNDASGVVNVATVFIEPYVLSSKVSASVTRTPFPSRNVTDWAVRSGAASDPCTAAAAISMLPPG